MPVFFFYLTQKMLGKITLVQVCRCYWSVCAHFWPSAAGRCRLFLAQHCSPAQPCLPAAHSLIPQKSRTPERALGHNGRANQSLLSHNLARLAFSQLLKLILIVWGPPPLALCWRAGAPYYRLLYWPPVAGGVVYAGRVAGRGGGGGGGGGGLLPCPAWPRHQLHSNSWVEWLQCTPACTASYPGTGDAEIVDKTHQHQVPLPLLRSRECYTGRYIW